MKKTVPASGKSTLSERELTHVPASIRFVMKMIGFVAKDK
jgi:hypothetical protein